MRALGPRDEADIRAGWFRAGGSVTVLSAGRVVLADAVLDPGWVEVAADRIVGTGSGVPPRPADVDLSGRTVLPGFIDVHVHGGGGASYTSGDPDEAERVVRFHRRHGTTTTLASLVTAAPAQLERGVAGLADLVLDGLLAGLHLEGPWLSAAHRGAHDPTQLRPPDPAEVRRLLRAGRGTVRMVTVAPELPGGLAAVRQVLDAGVVAAVGHTDATYDVTCDAIEAGATVGTHLFNAMRPLHHREPGPALALLEDPRVTVELIVDGVHLHPEVLRHAIGAAGVARVALVTDAMAAAGAGDGWYDLGGLAVQVSQGVARLVDGGAIAGSTLTMDMALRAAVGLGSSLPAAARMAATTPARTLGLDDRGAIEVGLRADLVVLDGALRVESVMRGGAWVVDPPGRAP